MGSDYLHGGSGSNNIIIGDVGYIIRRFDKEGNPVLNSDGSWHKDIILEEVGDIVGVNRISTKINVEELTAEDIMDSDMLFVAAAVDHTEQSHKYRKHETEWLTDLIRFNLVGSNFNDTLIGT